MQQQLKHSVITLPKEDYPIVRQYFVCACMIGDMTAHYDFFHIFHEKLSLSLNIIHTFSLNLDNTAVEFSMINQIKTFSSENCKVSCHINSITYAIAFKCYALCKIFT